MIVDFLKESSVGVCFKDFTTYAIRYSHVAIIPNVIVVNIPLIIAKVISIGDVNHGLQRIGNIHYPIDYRKTTRVVCLSYIHTYTKFLCSFSKKVCIYNKRGTNCSIVSGSEEEQEQYVTFEDFSKIHLKIGKIIHAESIPGMKKVLRVIVDIGIDQRDIVVGAAIFYKPKELIDKVVVICTNMEPRKIGSIISNGMLLAADGFEGKPIFLTIKDEAPIGAAIH
jgi:tRNA-binding protein